MALVLAKNSFSLTDCPKGNLISHLSPAQIGFLWLTYGDQARFLHGALPNLVLVGDLPVCADWIGATPVTVRVPELVDRASVVVTAAGIGTVSVQVEDTLIGAAVPVQGVSTALSADDAFCSETSQNEGQNDLIEDSILVLTPGEDVTLWLWKDSADLLVYSVEIVWLRANGMV